MEHSPRLPGVSRRRGQLFALGVLEVKCSGSSVISSARTFRKFAGSLAAARLEVARLTETLAAERADGNEIYGMNKVRFRQQREDIRRLVEAVEAALANACMTGRPGEDGYSYQVGRDGSE